MRTKLLNCFFNRAVFLVISRVPDNSNLVTLFSITVELLCHLVSWKSFEPSIRNMTDKGFNIFPGRKRSRCEQTGNEEEIVNSPLVIIYAGAFSNQNDIISPFLRGGRNNNRGSSHAKWSQTGVLRRWGDWFRWDDWVTCGDTGKSCWSRHDETWKRRCKDLVLSGQVAHILLGLSRLWWTYIEDCLDISRIGEAIRVELKPWLSTGWVTKASKGFLKIGNAVGTDKYRQKLTRIGRNPGIFYMVYWQRRLVNNVGWAWFGLSSPIDWGWRGCVGSRFGYLHGNTKELEIQIKAELLNNK